MQFAETVDLSFSSLGGTLGSLPGFGLSACFGFSLRSLELLVVKLILEAHLPELSLFGCLGTSCVLFCSLHGLMPLSLLALLFGFFACRLSRFHFDALTIKVFLFGSFVFHALKLLGFTVMLIACESGIHTLAVFVFTSVLQARFSITPLLRVLLASLTRGRNLDFARLRITNQLRLCGLHGV